jgi:hypothetical protein
LASSRRTLIPGAHFVDNPSMRPPRNPLPLTPAAPTRNNRRHGRLRTEHLQCRHGQIVLGDVTDLSASGLRLLLKSWTPLKPGACLGLALHWGKIAVPVRARVAWARRAGFRKYRVGLEFLDLTPSETVAVQHLARLAVSSLTIARACLRHQGE